MVELDDATRRALLARDGPPASARAEILAGLRTRLGGPDDPDDPNDPGDSGDPGDLGGGEGLPFEPGMAAAKVQLAWAAKIVGATLGLTAAGLMTVTLGAAVLGSPDSTPETVRSELGSPGEPGPSVESSAPASVEAPPIEPPPSEPAPSVELSPRKPEARVVRAAESTLAAELELVRAAEQLLAKNPAAALAKLELHAERFARGSLAPERDALRVELLCALGRRAAASEAQAQFFARHPDSPLRARVLASCGGTDLSRAGD